jgi:amidase
MALNAFSSARQFAAAIRKGSISAVEALDLYLERVDRVNPSLNAIVIDDRVAARKAAKAADRAQAKGAALGPLHGVPITVKESFNLTGQQTTWGYPTMVGNVAAEDALAVQRLKAAGAVVFGKTNIPIALADFQSYNAVYGTTNNPWDVTRGAGGSSGGSAAAIAAGLSALEFGSDIGGSIRNPAAYNGVFGHKPTWCLVPKRGHALVPTPVAEGDLSVIGPIARTAGDLVTAMDVTQGPDVLVSAGQRYALPKPPASLKGLRVGVWLDHADAPIDDTVRERIESVAATLRKAGAKIVREARPAFDPVAAHDTYLLLLNAQMSARRPDYDALVAQRQSLAAGDDSLDARMLRAATASFKDWFEANHRREALRWAWHDFFRTVDVLLCPITATPPFPHDHSEPQMARTMSVNGAEVPYMGQLFWAGLATCAYLPATIAPAGLTPDGLPVGVQIVGPSMGDRTTLWLAGQIESLHGGFVPPPGL